MESPHGNQTLHSTREQKKRTGDRVRPGRVAYRESHYLASATICTDSGFWLCALIACLDPLALKLTPKSGPCTSRRAYTSPSANLKVRTVRASRELSSGKPRSICLLPVAFSPMVTRRFSTLTQILYSPAGCSWPPA